MSTFQASHIETRVQKAIVKKIQALNRLNLSDSKDSNFFSTAKTLEEAQEAMGIDWLQWRDLTQAVPPKYTEFLGNLYQKVWRGD